MALGFVLMGLCSEVDCCCFRLGFDCCTLWAGLPLSLTGPAPPHRLAHPSKQQSAWPRQSVSGRPGLQQSDRRPAHSASGGSRATAGQVAAGETGGAATTSRLDSLPEPAEGWVAAGAGWAARGGEREVSKIQVSGN